VRDFATVAGSAEVDAVVADRALTQLEVDHLGLDSLDRRYLRCIAESYGGGPVGIETLAAALSEQRDTLEEVVEPYLLQQGLLQRTPRGRLLTRAAWQHLDLAPPRSAEAQAGLFDDDSACGDRGR
jgi:Holliday junction DNA helicase RuvB